MSGKLNYDTPVQDYSPRPIEIFEVGGKVYDKRRGASIEGEILMVWTDVHTRKMILGVEWEDGSVEVVLSDWVVGDPVINMFDVNFIGKGDEDKIPLWNEDSPAHQDREPKDLDQLNMTVPDITDLTTFVIPLSEKTGAKQDDMEKYILDSIVRYDDDGDYYFLKGDRKIRASKGNPYDSSFYVNGDECRPSEFFNEKFDEKIVVGSEGFGYYLKWGDKFYLDEEDLQDFLEVAGYDVKKIISRLEEEEEVELTV